MIVNNTTLTLIKKCILVLPDEGDKLSTGIVTQKTDDSNFVAVNDHVLFVRKMAAEVELNGIKYLAMHEDAVAGLITD